MFYTIGIIGAFALAAYWLWGMRKMVRMNNEPEQLVLAQLLVRAGNGNDDELLAFIREQRWTSTRIADRVAHALTLAEKLFRPDEYSRARAYADSQQARYLPPREIPLVRIAHETKEENGLGVRKRPQGEDDPVPPESPMPPENEQGFEQPRVQIHERQGFKANEFVVYPAHGVGQILAIEEQEIAGAKLELFVINFKKDKMTLRVPTAKVANVGMRKLSDPAAVVEAYKILTQPPHIAEGVMWSERAQEYEAKINSGDIVAIAEVVRDLYRSESQPKRSYSEHQLYEAALDRLCREVAVVRRTTETEAVQQCESLLIASALGRLHEFEIPAPGVHMDNIEDDISEDECPVCSEIEPGEREAFRRDLLRIPLRQEICPRCALAFFRNISDVD